MQAGPENERTAPAFAATVLAAAVLGALFGALYPVGQVAVEPAQLLAGLVSYPPGNGFWLYETRAWTALHQILAVPLLLGVGERTLSLVVSAGIGALNFAALGACARALGAAPAWSVFAPFLLWAMNPVSWGYGYPILLAGHPHTYGAVGLAWVLLGVASIAAGRFGAGAFLLGFAPALHASLGTAMLGLTGACVVAGRRALAPQFATLARGAAAGLALAFASLLLHRATLPEAPAPDLAAVDRLYSVYIEIWDAHRKPFRFADWRSWPLGLSLAIALAGLGEAAPERPAAHVLRRLVVGSALLGMAFAWVRQNASPDAIPQLVLSAMPTRILNVAVIAYLPLVVAQLTRRGASAAARSAAIALGAIAFTWQYAPWLQSIGVPAVGVAALIESAQLSEAWLARWAVRTMRWRPIGLAIGRGLSVAMAIGVAWVVVVSARSWPERAALALADRTTDAALAAAAEGEGLLAVAPGVERAQLATRRPIVVDPQAIDMVTYVPAALPALAHAIDGLYGIPFANPLLRDRNNAVIPGRTVRSIWEKRTPQEWVEVGRAFGARDVLVPASWELSLPRAAQSPLYALYRIAPDNS